MAWLLLPACGGGDEDAKDLWVGHWSGNITRPDGSADSFDMDIGSAEFLSADGQIERYRFDGTISYSSCASEGLVASVRGGHHQDRSVTPFADTFLFLVENCQDGHTEVFGGNDIYDGEMNGQSGDAQIGCTGASICGAPFEDFGCLFLCPSSTFTASRTSATSTGK